MSGRGHCLEDNGEERAERSMKALESNTQVIMRVSNDLNGSLDACILTHMSQSIVITMKFSTLNVHADSNSAKYI